MCLGTWKTSVETTLGSTQVFSSPRIRGWVWQGCFCHSREGMELGADPWKNRSSSLPLQSWIVMDTELTFFQHTQIVPRWAQAGWGAEPFCCPIAMLFSGQATRLLDKPIPTYTCKCLDRNFITPCQWKPSSRTNMGEQQSHKQPKYQENCQTLLHTRHMLKASPDHDEIHESLGFVFFQSYVHNHEFSSFQYRFFPSSVLLPKAREPQALIIHRFLCILELEIKWWKMENICGSG